MDKYDEDIEKIVGSHDPAKIASAMWDKARTLFQCATISGRPGVECGCLTQIRGGPCHRVAMKPELADEIRDDDRLPTSVCDLRLAISACKSPDEIRAVLQPFAEWQRRLDREIRGAVA